MERCLRSSLLTLALVVALIASAWPQAQRRIHAESSTSDIASSTPAQASAYRVYLPFLLRPADPPRVTISSPPDGGTISRTIFFAAQPDDPGAVSSVTFRAGSKDLGTDTNPADGFKVILDATTLPAGQQQLSASATGPSGSTTTTITVNVVPNPPGSGTVNAQGGVFASEIGSTITVPPGAVPAGTNVSVTEKSQQQTTAETGIDWDRLGVTFLGAQQVQAGAPLAKPLNVASAGFGNRVQPGQAVVNYTLLPDQDGDGVGELVAVNSASVAPNDDVISDPVPQLVLGAAATPQRPSTLVPAQQPSTLSGPPGTVIQIDATGLNPWSAQGNVAVYHSLVDGSEIRTSASVRAELSSTRGQIVTTLVPPLPAGAATLTFRNVSTGATNSPLNLTITAPPPLSRPPAEIIDQVLAAVLDDLNRLPPETNVNVPQAIAVVTNLRKVVQQTSSQSTADEARLLLNMAVMLANAHLLDTFAQPVPGGTLQLQDFCGQKDFSNAFGGATAALGSLMVSAVGGYGAALVAGKLAVAVFSAGIAIGLFGVALLFIVAVKCSQAPPACTPSPSAAGGRQGLTVNRRDDHYVAPTQSNAGILTGMGSAPPPGGSGCGGAVTAPSAGMTTMGLAPAQSMQAGRVIIKIFSRDGSRRLSPFTGTNDPGGYFYVPFIPAGEPFTAVAIDTATETTQRFDGVGPETGKSVYMLFDFSEATQGNRFTINIGDTVSNGVPGPGAGNLEQPNERDVYTFTAAAGQQVFFDTQAYSSSLQLVGWKLVDDAGGVVFNSIIAGQPGLQTLTRGGAYTMIVNDEQSDKTGLYQFKLWNVPPPNRFTINIGDTISNGVPGPGAGNIETPGVHDVYTFTAAAGQQVFFDRGDYNVDSLIPWKLADATGTVVFDGYIGGQGGPTTLTRGGTYTMTVGNTTTGQNDSTGTYQIKLWNVPPPDRFAIKIGDTISNGMPGPGAGNIETPGVHDVYTFTAAAGQQVFFDQQGYTVGFSLFWKLVDADGNVVFNIYISGEPGLVTLTRGGTYTMTVGDTAPEHNNDSTGTYIIQIRLP